MTRIVNRPTVLQTVLRTVLQTVLVSSTGSSSQFYGRFLTSRITSVFLTPTKTRERNDVLQLSLLLKITGSVSNFIQREDEVKFLRSETTVQEQDVVGEEDSCSQDQEKSPNKNPCSSQGIKEQPIQAPLDDPVFVGHDLSSLQQQ